MPKASITFTHLTKEFFLQEERTFKELIPSLILGKSWAKKILALNAISFSIAQGETVGIVGHNGAGKSTLMKLIAKVSYPTKGRVQVRGKVAPLIELGAGFHYELSGYENIYLSGAILGLTKKEIETELENIVAFSELKEYLATPLKRYSTGMVMRLAFSIAVHAKADIFLIDEVLAVGDARFQDKCLKKLEELKSQNKTILFVSHDERAVQKFCDRALLLEHGKLLIDDTPAKVFSVYEKTRQKEHSS